MLAMQYVIRLPEDFDMDVIRRRIHDKGALLDGFDGLLFKAYLYGRRGEDGPDNVYAPFYVWHDTAGMDCFLRGPGFAALTADFGRPAVQLWAVSRLEGLAQPRDARWAVFDGEPRDDALTCVSLYDPGPWTNHRIELSQVEPRAPRWRVGYVAASR